MKKRSVIKLLKTQLDSIDINNQIWEQETIESIERIFGTNSSQRISFKNACYHNNIEEVKQVINSLIKQVQHLGVPTNYKTYNTDTHSIISHRIIVASISIAITLIGGAFCFGIYVGKL